MWIGALGTVIKYVSAERHWEARVQGSDVWAKSEASYESLLLGLNDWMIYNDRRCVPQSYYTGTIQYSTELEFSKLGQS